MFVSFNSKWIAAFYKNELIFTGRGGPRGGFSSGGSAGGMRGSNKGGFGKPQSQQQTA